MIDSPYLEADLLRRELISLHYLDPRHWGRELAPQARKASDSGLEIIFVSGGFQNENVQGAKSFNKRMRKNIIIR